MSTYILTPDVPEIPASETYTFTGTRVEVSKDPLFQNNAILISSEVVPANQTEYQIEILDFTSTVYVRTITLFSDDTDSGPSRIVPIDSGFEGLTQSSVIIPTPILRTEIVNSESVGIVSFKISGSEFELIAGGGSHISTSWCIKTLDGVMKWERPEDVDNLTGINVPIKFLDKDTGYTVDCTYNSTGNNKSLPGRITFNTGTLESTMLVVGAFKLFTPRTIFIPLEYFNPAVTKIDIQIAYSDPKKLDSVIVKSFPDITPSPYLKIDTYGMSPEIEYEVRITGILNDADGTILNSITERRVLIGTEFKVYPYKGTDSVFNNQATYLHNATVGGTGYIYSKELSNGTFLSMQNNDNRLLINSFSAGTMYSIGETGIVLTGAYKMPHINVLELSTGTVVVNYDTENNESKVVIIDFNNAEGSFTVTNTITLPGTSNGTMYAGSMIWIEKDTIALKVMSADTDHESGIFVIDCKSGTVGFNKYDDLDFTAMNLVKKDNFNLLVGGGYKLDANEVEVRNNSFYTIPISDLLANVDTIDIVTVKDKTLFTTMPVDAVPGTYMFSTVYREDGEIIFYNAILDDTSVHSLQQTLMLKTSDGTWTINDNDIPDDLAYTNTFITTLGIHIRMSSRPQDPQYIYGYINGVASYNATATAIRDLYVRNGEVLQLESLDNFNSIEIETGGSLELIQQ